LDTLVVLSEDLAKFDGQFESATNKIVDVLRSAYKGDETRLDYACRIADRMIHLCRGLSDYRTTGILYYELSMLGPSSVGLNVGNSRKYRVDKPIVDILDMLVKVRSFSSQVN
jgi:hypothetical protein